MSDPITFASTSPRLAFPYLVAGQAQKEVFVNESLTRLDALQHPVISGSASIPPADPAAGECWIVEGAATGAWAEKAACLATWDGAEWSFASPVAGMKAWDATNASYRIYNGGWQMAKSVAGPAGGATVDSEARSTIIALLDALRGIGLIS